MQDRSSYTLNKVLEDQFSLQEPLPSNSIKIPARLTHATKLIYFYAYSLRTGHALVSPVIQAKHNTFTILPSPTSSHLPSISSFSIPPAYHPTSLPSSHTLPSGPSFAYEHPSLLCTFPSRQYRFTHLGKPTSSPFNLLPET